ncbi:MAG: hypothetical protein CM15mP74_37360 [Halieaceae bacterium]|nr:MAG: hypothetical protein CM15mP74_37360 [Halieaceae bacterium]
MSTISDVYPMFQENFRPSANRQSPSPRAVFGGCHEIGYCSHKAFQVDDVREALSAIGVQGITVSEVKGLVVRKATPSCIAARSMSLISYPRSKSISP